jgi:RNA polymerase sigma-70 factor, ECF subfamily
MTIAIEALSGPSALASAPAVTRHAVQHTHDATLLGRVASGDRAALQVLYARHHVRVYRFALRLVDDEALAEDLVSDVFIKVWQAAGQFEGRSQVSTWLLSITRFLAYSALRQRREEALDDGAAEAIVDTSDNAEACLEKKGQLEMLRRCVRKLSREQREIIDLVYYHQKSVKDVAAIVGVPSNTVKTRMFYARRRMAKLLKEMER